MLSGLHALGLTVANVAGHDLALGPAALRELEDSTGVQLVSANVLVAGKPLLRPYVILRREIDGRTVGIGITGVTMTTHGALATWPDSLQATIADPATSAREVLDLLEPQTDVQILLAALPVAQLDKLANALPGYEVLIAGAGDLREAGKAGPAPLVLSPGTKCKFLGWTALRAGPGRSLVAAAAGVEQLDARVPDDPAMAKRVQAMKTRLGEPRVPLAGTPRQPASPSGEPAPAPPGAESVPPVH